MVADGWGPGNRTAPRRLFFRSMGFRRMIEDVPDIHDIHLPPQALMGGVDANQPSIPADSGMGVHAVLVIGAAAFQFGERHEQFARTMEQEQVLKTVNV